MPISASRRLYLGMCHYYHQTFQNYTLLNPKTYWCFHRYIISQSYLVFSLSAQGAGRQCCYTARGNLKLGPPTGGSLNRFNTEAGVPTFSHFFQDHVPFVDCCLSSDKCERYFEKRPSDDSSRYKPPRPGEETTQKKIPSLRIICKETILV